MISFKLIKIQKSMQMIWFGVDQLDAMLMLEDGGKLGMTFSQVCGSLPSVVCSALSLFLYALCLFAESYRTFCIVKSEPCFPGSSILLFFWPFFLHFNWEKLPLSVFFRDIAKNSLLQWPIFIYWTFLGVFDALVFFFGAFFLFDNTSFTSNGQVTP